MQASLATEKHDRTTHFWQQRMALPPWRIWNGPEAAPPSEVAFGRPVAAAPSEVTKGGMLQRHAATVAEWAKGKGNEALVQMKQICQDMKTAMEKRHEQEGMQVARTKKRHIDEREAGEGEVMQNPTKKMSLIKVGRGSGASSSNDKEVAL